MLRITRIHDSESAEALKLEGKVVGPWVDALREACDGSGQPHLDLSAVSFVDAGGVKLLRELLARGATLASCSTLVEELLHRDEARFIERLRAGDESTCETLVRQYAGRLLAVARRFLRSEEDAADAVQDAFLSAFRSIGSFSGQSSLGTWLHRIAVNASLMKLRAQSRRRDVPIDDLLPSFDETGHHRQPVRSWAEQGHAILIRAETRARVRACIDQLPDAYRTVLLLRDVEELDTEETARQMGIAVGAVKTRLHRARQALRTLLEPLIAPQSPQA